MLTTHHEIWQCLVNIEQAKDAGVHTTTLLVRFFLEDAEIPVIAFPDSVKPVVVEITSEGRLLCENAAGLVITAPFFSSKYQKNIVVAASTFTRKLYLLSVTMDESGAVSEFLSIIETYDIGVTPYGNIIEILGLSHFNSISRETEEVNDELAFYVKTLNIDSISISGKKLTIRNASRFFTDLAPHWKKVIPWHGHWTHTWVGPFDAGVVFTNTTGTRVYQTIRASGSAPFPAANLESPETHTVPLTVTGWWSNAAAGYWFRRLLARYEIVVMDKRKQMMQVTLKEESLTWTGEIAPGGTAVWDEINDEIVIEFAREIDPGALPTFTRRYVSSVRITGLDNTTSSYYWNQTGEWTVLQQTAQLGSEAKLCLIVMKDDFNFDSDRDMIVPLSVTGPNLTDYIPLATDFFPKGLAIMYPYAYILTYTYVQAPQSPLMDDSIPISIRNNRVTGMGWQMCLERIDLVAGRSVEKIIIKSNEYFRFNYGLPAVHTDWQTYARIDKHSIGSYSKYRYSDDPTYKDKYATSDHLPQQRTYEFPTLAGLASVSAHLITVHNGAQQPWLINPVTGYLEAAGFSMYPFAFPSNQNIDVKNELLYTAFDFQNAGHYGAYPFMHLCIGDGLPPTPWSTSLDVQDVSAGEFLIRRAKVRNSLLRDMITQVTLSVPDPTVLPNSEMLWLSLNPLAFGETPDPEDPLQQVWFKEITFPEGIYPCETADFWIKVAPEVPEEDPVPGEGGQTIRNPITLYFNATFNRKTVLHGYQHKLPSSVVGH